MRITSWNVNGLKTLRPLAPLFESLNSDIICIQETRVSAPDDINFESIAFVKGYHSFFSISKLKRGYSGVATFCRERSATPLDAGEGLCNAVGGATITVHNTVPDTKLGQANQEQNPFLTALAPEQVHEKSIMFDSNTMALIRDEGRCVITDHGRFVLINVYVPAVTVPDRAPFQMQFLHALRAKVEALQNKGRKVIVVGDFNLCPSLKDRADRLPSGEYHKWMDQPTRRWFRALLRFDHMVDTFRQMHPEATRSFSCWSEATRARQNNHGQRIDFIVVSSDLYKSDITDADLWPYVKGSDHCPVTVVLQHEYYKTSSALKPPQFCTQFMPRFRWQQQSLDAHIIPKHTDSSSFPGSFANETKDSPQLQPQVKRESVKKQIQKKSAKSSPISKRKKVQMYFQKQPQSKPAVESINVMDQTCFPNISRVYGHSDTGVIDFRNSQEATVFDFANSDGESKPGQDKTQELTIVSQTYRATLAAPLSNPLCDHRRRSVLKTVKKSGENRGRTFFRCEYPSGIGNKADCGFFKWAH